MSSLSPSPSVSTIVHQFTTFLTVAIHTILYERHVYPQQTFLTARKYNFPVRQSRHPKVCAWINDAVAAVEAEMLKGIVARVTIVLFSPQGDKAGNPLERFVFDVSRFLVVPASESGTPLLRGSGERDGTTALYQSKDTQALPEVDLEEQLRGMMSKISVCGSQLKQIPNGCTFTIGIELKDEADPPVGHPQPWIPAQPGLQNTIIARGNEEFGGDQKTMTKKGDEIGGAKTIPVRTVDAGEMMFEMWIEESKKQEISENTNNSEASSF